MRVEDLKKYQMILCRLFYSVIITIIYLVGSNLFAQQLYFIHNGPTMITGTPQVPHETRIYSLDKERNELKQVWTLGTNLVAEKIGVYSTPGKVLILDSGCLNIISMNDINKISRLELDNVISNYRYYDIMDNSDIIEIRMAIRNNDNSYEFQNMLFSIKGNKIPFPEKDSTYSGEIRLCGTRPIGCYEHDLIGFHELPESKIIIGTCFEFDAVHVPDSIIRSESTRGWNLMANEPDFYALVSVPESNNHLIKRELLIYNNTDKNWKSILMEGSATSLRLVNNWMTGEVLYKKTEFNHERHKTYPPLLKGHVILINPLANNHFYINLGFGGTVLWIEDDIVYYKTVDKSNAYLYKARIENDGFVDKELLSTDPVVRFFCWAFRGSIGE